MNNPLAGFGLDINNLEDIQSRFESKPKETEPETNKTDITGLEELAGFSGLGAGLETLNNKKVSSPATKPKDNTDRDELLKALERELDPDKKFVKRSSLKEVSEQSRKNKNRLENVAKSRGPTPDKIVTLNLPDGWNKVGTDVEYIPVTNYPTVPLCVQFADSSVN